MAHSLFGAERMKSFLGAVAITVSVASSGAAAQAPAPLQGDQIAILTVAIRAVAETLSAPVVLAARQPPDERMPSPLKSLVSPEILAAIASATGLPVRRLETEMRECPPVTATGQRRFRFCEFSRGGAMVAAEIPTQSGDSAKVTVPVWESPGPTDMGFKRGIWEVTLHRQRSTWRVVGIRRINPLQR